MAKDTFNLNEWVGNKERRLLKEDHEELTPEEMANQNADSPMHRPEGLEEDETEEGKDISKLKIGEEFMFNGRTYTFIELDPEHKNTADVRDSEGIKTKITIGGGKVNREQDKVRQTGVADTGQGKGHHIDEETDQEKLQRTFDDDPNYQKRSSDPLEKLTLDDIIRKIGYDDFKDFFEDNQGAEEAVTEWILTVENFRQMLGVIDDEDIYN